jgi:hypothetical protein
MYNNRLYIANSTELKKLIMDEFHRRPYVGHHGYQKMITIVIYLYDWPRMRKDVVEYNVKFLECQQVKVEHKHPLRLLQPTQIMEWKWEIISMEFITRLPRIAMQKN